MARIYTRTGDDGTTGLIGGKRVSKDSPFVEATGSLDETNAVLGLLRSRELPQNIDSVLQRIQDDLFALGAELARPEGVPQNSPQRKSPRISEKRISEIETEIDELQACLPPLDQFILPGGTPEAALLHLTRAVVRRTERACVGLARVERVDPRILRYLNRLSDLCFVLARYMNHKDSVLESHPRYGADPSNE